MFVEPTLAASACSGACNCYDQYFPSWSDAQHLWYADVYYFLNYCGEGPYGYSMPVSNKATVGGTADYWLNEGNRLYLLGRYQESLDNYNATLNLEPQNRSALEGKAKALTALNRTAKANAIKESP